MPKFLAAVIQLNSQPDLNRNMTEVYRWLGRAAKEGVSLVGLPENFAFMGDEKERFRQAEKISEIAEEKFTEWAKEFGVTILGGGYPVLADNGKVFNRAVLVNPKGEITASYDKIHLFDVELSAEEKYAESDMVQPGREVVTVEMAELNTRVGLSICYDVRFPELYRKLSKEGSDILCVPAAFTKTTGEAHWEILLRSRAIENSAFVIAPAQTGRHGEKRETYGHSMIIDPWGTVLADAGIEPGMAMAEIDLEKISDVRKKLPSWRHRVL